MGRDSAPRFGIYEYDPPHLVFIVREREKSLPLQEYMYLYMYEHIQHCACAI